VFLEFPRPVWRLIAPTPARADTDGYSWPPAVAIVTVGSVGVAVIRVGWVGIAIIRVAVAVAIITTAIGSAILSSPVGNLLSGRIGFR